MSCSINDFDGYNAVDVVETRTARKVHRCKACRSDSILPGHKYEIHRALFDGTWTQSKRCMRCSAIYAHLEERMRKDNDEEIPEWNLDCGHTYQERWGEEPPPEIAALAFALPGEVT